MKISICGIRRSGNHAIATWLLHHFNGSTEYYNNYASNYTAKRNREIYINNDGMLLKLQPIDAHDTYCDNNKIDVDNIIYGYENITIDEINKKSKEYPVDYNIIIIRDPINNLASLMKHANKSRNSKNDETLKIKKQNEENIKKGIQTRAGVNSFEKSSMMMLHRKRTLMSYAAGALIQYQKFIPLWKDYVNNFDKNDKNILIIYDRWFSDSGYRREIEKKLKLLPNDKGLNKIHGTANGSSFDNMKFQDKAQKMDVINRWKEFVDNEKYLKLLNDEEMLILREKKFGPLPFTI